MDFNSLLEAELDRVRMLGISALLTQISGVGNNVPSPSFTFKKEDVKKKNPRKLNRKIAREIYELSHKEGLSHKEIVSTIKETYGISIVPHTVSDIKLGKRWKGVGDEPKGVLVDLWG